MKNSDNKEQMVRVMLTVWSQDKMAKKIVGRKIILVCGNKAYLLASADGHNIHYREEETDTRVLISCMQRREDTRTFQCEAQIVIFSSSFSIM